MPTVKKAVLFKKERTEVINKLIEIMELDQENSFYLYDLENNEEKKQKILEQKEDIIKYFKTGKISAFNKSGCKRPQLNILRNILRQHGYKIESGYSNIIRENKKIKTIRYFVFGLDKK